MQKMVFAVAVLALCLSACTGKNNIQISKNAPFQTIGRNLKGQWVEIREPQERVIAPNIYQYTSETPEVVRYDRYLLVGSSPQEGQKYLLEQLIEIDITPKKNKLFNATIRQGLNASLADTGFRLCHSTQGDTATLLSLPLPKIHYKFGPMRLREALEMIAGPAYDLTVNDIDRTVCFKSRPVMEREKLAIPKTEVTTTVTEIVETEE